MASYTVPGTYVTESPLAATAQVLPNGQAVGAFFGRAVRGPVTPTLISDWTSFRTLFGPLVDAYDLGYSVYHYFTNGGRACYVTRVVASDAVAADSTDAGGGGVQWTPAGGSATTLFDVTATSPGTWGNGLTVQTLQGSVTASATRFPSFTVVIELDGVEVERWVDCELDPTSARYVTSVVNTYSNFIRVSNVNADGDTPDDADAFVTTKFALADGDNGTADDDADYATALNGLDTIEGSLIINLPGVVEATPVGAAVSKAGSRGDSFVIIDPDRTDTTFAEIQTTASNFASAAPASYAAAYAPALQMIDPARSGPTAVRTTAPGGAIAGIMVRTDVQRTPAKAPAGYAATVTGAFAPSVRLTQAQIGTLYNGAVPVNSFRTVPGAGVNIIGARTLNKGNIDKYINVRRTLNYIKFNLKTMSEFAPFEANDERLWERLRNQAASFLGNFWRQGGLAGARVTEAFFVVCDSSNNTPGSIANGEVHMQVGVALSTPAEFVVIDLAQWSGGASSATEAL